MEEDESVRRAEFLDNLAHPIRIMILKMLQQKSMSFSELKKDLGIESSGHLQYHIRKLGNMVKQDAYGKYAISDDGREVIRFLEIAGQLVATKPRFKISWKKALCLMLIILALSALVIPEIWQRLSKQIPLYENLDLSEDFIMIGGKEFRYLLITTSELENGTRIFFRGIVFTYLAPTTLRLSPVRMTYGEIEPSNPITEMEVTFAGFKAEYKDGQSEIIPIMPWVRGEDTIPMLVLIRDHGNLWISYSPFYGEAKALAFQIGPRTMMLLVRAR